MSSAKTRSPKRGMANSNRTFELLSKEIQLPCRRPSAERNNDRPDRRSGEEHLEPFYAVVAKQAYSVTAPDPGPAQALRHSPSPGRERCIGDAAYRP